MDRAIHELGLLAAQDLLELGLLKVEAQIGPSKTYRLDVSFAVSSKAK
jgi:hypothetical protein